MKRSLKPHPFAARLAAVVVATLCLVPALRSSAQAPTPPLAAERPVQLEKHGDVRSDPWFWLRERDNPDVIAYLEAENAYFDAVMKPLAALRDSLFEEIKGRIKQDDSSVPYSVGDYWYYSRFEEGQQYPIAARKRGSLDAPESVLLDVNELADGYDYYNASFAASSISPDGRYYAWSADTTGRRLYTIRILDMASGNMLPDVIGPATANLAWANDSRTLFYTTQDQETLRWDNIYRHTVGADASDDVLVYNEPDDEFYTFVFRSSDDKYIIIASTQTLSAEYRFLSADSPAVEPTVFLPRERGHEYDLDHGGDAFYMRSNHEAENFQLLRVDDETFASARPADLLEAADVVIEHRDEVLFVGYSLFSGHLVATERHDGLNRLRVRPLDEPASEHYVTFDDPAYSVSVDVNPTYETSTLRYTYESPSTPSTWFDYDMNSRDRTLLKQTEVLGGKFDPDNYRVERLAAPARDGKFVPVTVVYRADLVARNGSAPMLLYGYGSYGASIPPSFSSPRLSLLDRGFVYAIAHIRGSETLGRAWYEDGKLLNKKNTFQDFIDVAEYLAREGYADSEQMYAMGGSAGGLLMGAVMNMRPDLFDGIVAHVPWVDVVTTMLDDTIPLTTNEYDEWGNPNDKTYYEYMLSYSPYDNVIAADYPHVLVTTGLNDSQVQYWEPAKWVAKLRRSRTDDDLLLLHTNMGAGHGGASGRFEQYRETARDYAFLINLARVVDS
jgi:oligopeptidase B